jgi:hypothetical protein
MWQDWYMADTTDGERIAEERIAEAARTGQDWLDLGDLGLARLPEGLSKLTKLKRLSLGSFIQVNAEGLNGRTGPLERSSLSDIGALSGLSALSELYLENTQCDDLSPINGLLQLQCLVCSSTKVSNLTPIKGLLQLQCLDCGYTKVSDLTPIAGLLQLQRLDCGYTKVSDLTPIAGLIDLERVEAERCSIGFIPKSIKNLEKLIVFNLRRNKIKRLPRELGELGALEKLMLVGNPLEDPLPELIDEGQPQATINVLRWLRSQPIEAEAKEPDPPTPVEDADDPPAIPEQGAGPRVILDQTGRLVFARPSDLDAKGNDRNRLEALHPALREAAADLVKALQDHPSNLRNERLLQKAEAYHALVDLPLDEVNFARLYGAGMQLLNAAGATRRALEAGRADVPDLTPLQDECLASIENLHPPFVLASRDGQEMLADQTTIKLTAEAVEGIKEAGTELGQELINHPDLADREVGETIRDAAAEIGQGDNEARDAVNTVSTMRNVTIVLSAGAVAVAIPSVAGAMLGPEGVVAGGIPAWFITKVTEKTKAFESLRDAVSEKLDGLTYAKLLLLLKRFRNYRSLLLKLEPHLRKVTHLPAFKWLDPIIDRLKRKSPPDKKE